MNNTNTEARKVPAPPIYSPDVLPDGKAVHDLIVKWKGKDGVEHSYTVKKGESTGELGKGKLKDAVEAWTA